MSERFLLPSLNSKPPASSSVSYQNPLQNDKGPVGGGKLINACDWTAGVDPELFSRGFKMS